MDSVKAQLLQVTGIDPILFPANLPPTFVATNEGQSAGGLDVVFTEPNIQKRLSLAVLVPNPGPPTEHTQQTRPVFRGVTALYQVQDQTQPTSYRFLLWDEPGRWTTIDGQRDSVTYFLTAQGMTDAEFWRYANGLQSIHR